jgi:hypothetical protein
VALYKYIIKMANFPFLFGGALVICAGITFRSSDYYKQVIEKNRGAVDDDITPEQKKAHHALLTKYLFVYLLATFSDWLQGPYVYALYMAYGFNQHEIAQLFVAGFGSSMIFGSFVGGMADWGGRKAFVILFAFVYAASCMTKRKSHNEYGSRLVGYYHAVHCALLVQGEFLTFFPIIICAFLFSL